MRILWSKFGWKVMKKFDQRRDWGVEHCVPRGNKKNEKKNSLGIRPAPYAAPAYPLPPAYVRH